MSAGHLLRFGNNYRSYMMRNCCSTSEGVAGESPNQRAKPLACIVGDDVRRLYIFRQSRFELR